jgi:hypothetical protein
LCASSCCVKFSLAVELAYMIHKSLQIVLVTGYIPIITTTTIIIIKALQKFTNSLTKMALLRMLHDSYVSLSSGWWLMMTAVSSSETSVNICRLHGATSQRNSYHRTHDILSHSSSSSCGPDGPYGPSVFCLYVWKDYNGDFLLTTLSKQPWTWHAHQVSNILNVSSEFEMWTGFNPLRPSGNYMNHLLWQSVMLHFVFIGFVWLSL